MATIIEIPVRSTDMDADRVVNNAMYFLYFEQGRLAHLQRLGAIRRPRQRNEPSLFTLAASEVRYLAPVVYPETLRIRSWTHEVRRRSFILAYDAVRVSDDVRVAEGSSAQGWLDIDGKPSPIPDEIRQMFMTSLPSAEGDEPSGNP